MSLIILHHLSDIHVGADHYHPKPLNVDSLPQNHGVPALRLEQYLSYLKATTRPKPDLIVVSGDLTSSARPHEFDRAVALLVEIAKTIAVGQTAQSGPRVCLVPGNHDVDWNKSDYRDRQLLYVEKLKPFSDYIYALDVKTEPFFILPNTNILIYLFNTCRLGGSYEKRSDGSKPPISKKGAKSETPRLDVPIIFDAELETMQENVIKLDQQYPADLFKIAVMHHNPSPSPTHDVDRFEAIVGAGRLKARLLDAGFDLVLHGHMHLPHCAYEEFLPDRCNEAEPRLDADYWDRHPYAQGIFLLGAPSLGHKYMDQMTGSRWFEVQIEDERHAHRHAPPTSLVRAFAAVPHTSAHYAVNSRPSYRFAIGKPLFAKLRLLHDYLDRKETSRDTDLIAKDAMKAVLAPLLRLMGRIEDWSTLDPWQDKFLDGLSEFRQILGVDMLGPTGWINPTYLTYLYQQFSERAARKQKEHVFSPQVLTAIRRTQWCDDSIQLVEAAVGWQGLEIVRILLWDRQQVEGDLARYFLTMIDALHRTFQVPVFFLDRQMAELDDQAINEEFVLAVDSRQKNSCYVYDLAKPDEKTQPVKENRADIFMTRYQSFLANENLVSIPTLLKTLR